MIDTSQLFRISIKYRHVKCATEWFLAFFGVLVALPVLLVLAALIRLTSSGPVFYISGRLGYRGQTFRLYKLRSMRLDATPVFGTDGKVLTLKSDTRLTPIGKFLRLGFDELPQLFNVLKGDMCLIGPRPDVPWEKDRYTERQQRRLEVRPGITGLAQVVGGRYMNNAQNYELDVLYVERSTWRTDMLILLLTLPYSLGMERIGAKVFHEFVEAVRPLGDNAA